MALLLTAVHVSEMSWFLFSFILKEMLKVNTGIPPSFVFKIMGYCEGAWFNNNFAKVLSACNYYAGMATTSNAVSFMSL